jgi:aerobic carbon-monoxide dehydrogenase medium subunit
VSTLPPFELHRPTTVDEATGLLDELGDDAVVYSGGTELLLVMKLGFSDYSHLVDVKRIAELHRLEASEDLLEVGAAVTHRQAERSPVVRERWPAFASMERHVGNLRVRVMGTIGGNLCFADPHSDPATFLLATGGTLVCRRGDGPARELPVEDFWEGPYRTALGPGELVTAVRLPHPGAGAGIAHEKISLHERPAVTVTCLAHVADGQVSSARVAVGSVGNRPQRARSAPGYRRLPKRLRRRLTRSRTRTARLSTSASWCACSSRAARGLPWSEPTRLERQDHPARRGPARSE